MSQSVIVRCTAAVDLADGKTISHLAGDPTEKLNGEHIISSLRRSTVDLIVGKCYLVTFEEITSPADPAQPAES
jgi:hypothetical protein